VWVLVQLSSTASENLIDRFVASWQPRSCRELSHEESAQITEADFSFFNLLANWSRAEFLSFRKNIGFHQDAEPIGSGNAHELVNPSADLSTEAGASEALILAFGWKVFRLDIGTIAGSGPHRTRRQRASSERRLTRIESFRARAEARALLYVAGELTLHESVDALQTAAVADGLVAAIGQDAVQAILAEAFREAADELE
jgi:hypothetical protein